MRTNALRVGIVLIFLGLAIWAITLKRYELVISSSEIGLWLTEALVSVGPELAGIVIGVVTIDYLNEGRQDEQLKEQMILQVGSKNNDVTDTAVRTLRARGWLEDGALKGADLRRANLEEADLGKADLSGTRLERANMKRANLEEANLKEARLWDANLEGASLGRANLQGASLRGANLEGAGLGRANLEGTRLEEVNFEWANLEEANLNGSDLEGANFKRAILRLTTMPDGIQLKGPVYPDGPTYEEWLATQDGQEEEPDGA